MKYEIADKVRKLTPYQPLTGACPIRLDANESFIDLGSDEPTPDDYINRRRPVLRGKVARRVAYTAFNRYPDPLCVRLCALAGRVYGVDPGCLTVGDGSDELISLILSGLCQTGEKVLTLEPDFSMYAFYTSLYEKKLLRLVRDETRDAGTLIRRIQEEGIRTVLFSNPCNPTGEVLPRAFIERLAEGTDALIVVDEAYMEFCEEQEKYSVLSLAPHMDNLIVLKTASKAFGMAALRLGFAVAGEMLTKVLHSVKSPYNVSTLTQAAGEVLLEDPCYLARCVALIRASKEELEQGLLALVEKKGPVLELVPTHTNFVYIRLENAPAIFEALLREGIAVRQMGAHLRITAGMPKENETFLQALERLL